MRIELYSQPQPEKKGYRTTEFSIEDMDQKTGVITVGIDCWKTACNYHLTRDEARQVWEHLGRELGFTEN